MTLPRFVRVLLYPLSLIYGRILRVRSKLYDAGKLPQRRLKAAVVSVGNLSVGGTGKTPMVLWLAERFAAEGKRVAILSRGYHGRHGTSDEIELLKRRLENRVLFGVGADRYEMGRALEQQEHVDVFILDDGFQHRGLARDVDILMLDGTRKLRNEWLLPAGSLREPISACNRADLIIVSRKFERPDTEAVDSHCHSIFYAQTRLLGFRPLDGSSELFQRIDIGQGPFFAFCGIGNPQGFFADLQRWHVTVAGTRAFRDHHKYSRREVQMLESAARAAGAQGLVTTEKDSFNVPEVSTGLPIWVAVIDFVFSNESELLAAIDRKLSERRGTRDGVPA